MTSYKMRVKYKLVSTDRGGIDIEVPEGESPLGYTYHNAPKLIEVPPNMTLVIGDLLAVEGLLVQDIHWLMDRATPSAVLYAKAAPGHVLDEEVCDRIQASIDSLGFRVVSRWNVGSDGVSFETKGRDGITLLTSEQRAVLRGSELVSEATRPRAGMGPLSAPSLVRLR